MRSFNNQTNFVLFFLVLCLGWQCGGGDGKAGRNDRDASVADGKADGAGQDASPDHISDRDSNQNPDEDPPLYDLNGEWRYNNINFPQGCRTTLKQTGNLIEFSEGCPTSSKSEGILTGNQIDFCTDFIQHMRYCHTGQVLSPIKMEGKTYILWDYGERTEGSEWSMNKAD